MSRLVLNSVFSYILLNTTLNVIGFVRRANFVGRVAQCSGERRLLACSRRQLADDNIECSSFSASRRKEQASCLRSPESKRLRIFQQLDHTPQSSHGTAAIETAM